MSNIRKSLVGVNSFSNHDRDRDLYTAVCIICSFSKILSKNTLYRDECFMKIGTPVEPTKVRGSTTFDRIGHAKLKRKKKKKHTVHNTSGKRHIHIDDPSACLLPSTNAHSVTCASIKCTVGLTILMCVITNHWFLSNKGNLDHILRVQKHAVYESITAKYLNESEFCSPLPPLTCNKQSMCFSK